MSYKKGIEASMNFLDEYTPEEYAHGHAISPSEIASFLSSPKIQLDGINDLEQILMQRYLAGFLHDPENAYFNYRRTGFPRLDINASTSLNEVKDKMPLRWRYPESESSYNQENLKEAISRQFNGNDGNNESIWIIK